MYPFRNAVTVSHMMTEPYARQAHVLVDMTCGNGHDTAFLARTMPDDAVLYAFDIQPCAIERTRQRLQDEGLGDKDVYCRCGSHEQLLADVQSDIDIIVFNLGYLPSGDHKIHTNCEITLKAIKIGLNKIAINGIIMIAAYPGTEAGACEEQALRSFLQTIPQQDFHISSWQPVNEVHCPPVLYIVQKRGKKEGNVIMKRFRYTKIKEIVQSRPIETQEELAKALQEEGIEVTQATVSRDIKELMLIKVPTSDGHYRYALSPEQNMLMSKNRMARLFQDSIVRVDSAYNQIIVHTLPGSANPIAAAIDHARWENVIGTLAGDDTVLLIVKDTETVPKLVKLIVSLMKE